MARTRTVPRPRESKALATDGPRSAIGCDAQARAMLPQVTSLIRRGLEGDRRTRALSLYSAVIAGGSPTGQPGRG